jgi:hypothetical protein
MRAIGISLKGRSRVGLALQIDLACHDTGSAQSHWPVIPVGSSIPIEHDGAAPFCYNTAREKKHQPAAEQTPADIAPSEWAKYWM